MKLCFPATLFRLVFFVLISFYTRISKITAGLVGRHHPQFETLDQTCRPFWDLRSRMASNHRRIDSGRPAIAQLNRIVVSRRREHVRKTGETDVYRIWVMSPRVSRNRRPL